ncbi:SOUL heme-binding protein [Haematococcus lacustris]
MASIFGIRREEEPGYKVVSKYPEFEVREYAPQIRAEVTMNGSMDSQMGPAFRALAGYIFGGNEARPAAGSEGAAAAVAQKIAMTAPVGISSAPAQKIAMTAPVGISQGASSDAGSAGTTMTFTMPSKFKSIEELPVPKDSRVKLVQVPEHKLAVIRFSWGFNQARKAEMESKLRAAADREGLKLSSSPEEVQLMGYDPPWTLPWCRRNEVAIPVLS